MKLVRKQQLKSVPKKFADVGHQLKAKFKKAKLNKFYINTLSVTFPYLLKEGSFFVSRLAMC